MAAFGIPQAHEDDAERAVRAALAILESVRELGLEARIGDRVRRGRRGRRSESTFATGEAVNVAARLAAGRGARADPDRARRAPAHARPRRGRGRRARSSSKGSSRADLGLARRLRRRARAARAPATRQAPLVGRDAELELLAEHVRPRASATAARTSFTIYGEPGVGKSRLAREFVGGARGRHGALRPLPARTARASRTGRSPRWSRRRPGSPTTTRSTRRSRSCATAARTRRSPTCSALASGVLEAVEAERSQQEIAWAAREWARAARASAQPLVLVFEDIHWAEEPLLELIEHLADLGARGAAADRLPRAARAARHPARAGAAAACARPRSSSSRSARATARS